MNRSATSKLRLLDMPINQKQLSRESRTNLRGMETEVTAKISDSCFTFACVGWADGEADLGKGLIFHGMSAWLSAYRAIMQA